MKAINAKEPQRAAEGKLTSEDETAKVEVKLEDLIPNYFTNNENKKSSTKTVENLGKLIKEIMGRDGVEEFIVDDIKANYSTSKSVGFEEDSLIAILKEILPEEQLGNIVKLKEYVDYDSLENAIYEGEIKAVALQSAQTTKETITLRVNRVKSSNRALT